MVELKLKGMWFYIEKRETYKWWRIKAFSE